MAELKGELCTFCGEKKLTLREEEMDIPYFGKVFILTMECSGCNYRKADVEPAERKEPCRYTFEVTGEADLSVKVIKSGEGTVKIPHIMNIESGPASDGYVTNVEGLLEKVKSALETSAEVEEEDSAKKKIKNLIKKVNNIQLGRESVKIILEDPSGHSAIVSNKAQKSKL